MPNCQCGNKKKENEVSCMDCYCRLLEMDVDDLCISSVDKNAKIENLEAWVQQLIDDKENNTESNAGYISLWTLDGNAHVIPLEVFIKIINGDMDIESLEDWKLILRSITYEWIRILKRQEDESSIIDDKEQ